MLGLGKFFGSESYVNSVVDDVVNACELFGFSEKLSPDDAKKIINDRYSANGVKSIRANVLKREIIDRLNDKYFNQYCDIGLPDLIMTIMAKENLSVSIDPKTGAIISKRLVLKKK
jgi:hypothetical protein